MLKATDSLHIVRIPLCRIQVSEYQDRYPERLLYYIELLNAHEDEYPGLVTVEPSRTHEGMFTLLDGHHRFCAAVMCGRQDLLCLVVIDTTILPQEEGVAEEERYEGEEVQLDYDGIDHT